MKHGKLLALVLALALCICLLPSALAASAYKAGDINGDGAVKASDLVRLLRYLNNEPVELIGDGDVNGDGAVDLGDAIRLLKHLVDRNVTIYPTPEPTETPTTAPTPTPAETATPQTPTREDFIRYAQAGQRVFEMGGQSWYVPSDIWNQYKPGGTGSATPTPAPTATPHSHSWGSWTTTVSPTCTSIGTKVRTCSTCGVQESESIPTISHSWTTSTVHHDEVGHWEQQTIIVGYYYVCTDCGAKFSDYDSLSDHHWDAGHGGNYMDYEYSYNDVWVVDVAAYDEPVTVCSTCGARG